jgi:hypothetical protein
VIEYDASELEFVSARVSDELSSAGIPVFFWHAEEERRVQVDLAILGSGVTLGDRCDVALLTFRGFPDGHPPEIAKADLRSVGNVQMLTRLDGTEAPSWAIFRTRSTL